MAEKTLEDMRRGIKGIDSDIGRLLGRRMKLAQKIGKLKQERRMPIVDSAAQKAAFENFISTAHSAGVETEFAKRIMSLIIEGSVEIQERMRLFDSAERFAAKVAVIGAGGMGSWFARFFKSRGSYVTVSDSNERRARLLASRIGVRWASSNVRAVMGSDVIVLAVPANTVQKVVDEVLSSLRIGSLLVEISAVKSPVTAVLRSAEKRGIQVASIHPLFGPLATNLWEKKVVIVRIGKQKPGIRNARKLLGNAHFLLTNSKVHDQQTALTLALPHFLNMAFAMTISKSNVAEVRRFAGRTFDLQMLLAESVASEPETTADIQIMNREFQSVLRQLQRNVGVLAGTVKRRDRAALVASYRQIQDRLQSDPNFAFAGAAFEKACEAASTISVE